MGGGNRVAHIAVALGVAVAGGLGATVRYLIDVLMPQNEKDTFPFSTFLINVSGSFAIGLLAVLIPDGLWSRVLLTGFLGGYTTFSAASVQTLRLLRISPVKAAAYSLGTLVAAVVAVAAGIGLASLL